MTSGAAAVGGAEVRGAMAVAEAGKWPLTPRRRPAVPPRQALPGPASWATSPRPRSPRALYRPDPAGALPDPKLLRGLANLPEGGPDAGSLSRDLMTRRRVGLLQEFPSGAKRAGRVADGQGRLAVVVVVVVAEAQAQGRRNRPEVMRQTALAWIARESAENRLAGFPALVAGHLLREASVRARLVAGQGASTGRAGPAGGGGAGGAAQCAAARS